MADGEVVGSEAYAMGGEVLVVDDFAVGLLVECDQRCSRGGSGEQAQNPCPKPSSVHRLFSIRRKSARQVRRRGRQERSIIERRHTRNILTRKIKFDNGHFREFLDPDTGSFGLAGAGGGANLDRASSGRRGCGLGIYGGRSCRVGPAQFEGKWPAVGSQDHEVVGLAGGVFDCIDSGVGRVPLSEVAAEWLNSRGLVKRRTRESDESNWRNYVRPRFGNWPVAAITAAEVSAWVGGLVDRGLAPATATRALATLRSIFAFAVADGRVPHMSLL